MWGKLATDFCFAGIAAVLGIEVARFLVHRRRERRDGLGATQDVAIFGVLVAAVLFTAVGIFGLSSMFVR